MSSGVLDGANKPYHGTTSKPGTPASDRVGTSGTKVERLGVVMASILSLPARAMLAITGCPNMKDTSPDITAASACGTPL